MPNELYDAAKNGDVQGLQALLKAKEPLHQIDGSVWNTPIYIATKNGHLACLYSLLAYKPAVTKESLDWGKYNHSVLLDVAQAPHLASVLTAAQHEDNVLKIAAQLNHAVVIESLIPSVFSFKTHENEILAAMQKAAELNHWECFQAICKSISLSVNFRDYVEKGFNKESLTSFESSVMECLFQQDKIRGKNDLLLAIRNIKDLEQKKQVLEEALYEKKSLLNKISFTPTKSYLYYFQVKPSVKRGHLEELQKLLTETNKKIDENKVTANAHLCQKLLPSVEVMSVPSSNESLITEHALAAPAEEKMLTLVTAASEETNTAAEPIAADSLQHKNIYPTVYEAIDSVENQERAREVAAPIQQLLNKNNQVAKFSLDETIKKAVAFRDELALKLKDITHTDAATVSTANTEPSKENASTSSESIPSHGEKTIKSSGTSYLDERTKWRIKHSLITENKNTKPKVNKTKPDQQTVENELISLLKL